MHKTKSTKSKTKTATMITMVVYEIKGPVDVTLFWLLETGNSHWIVRTDPFTLKSLMPHNINTKQVAINRMPTIWIALFI